jgi:hypothetical protein
VRRECKLHDKILKHDAMFSKWQDTLAHETKDTDIQSHKRRRNTQPHSHRECGYHSVQLIRSQAHSFGKQRIQIVLILHVLLNIALGALFALLRRSFFLVGNECLSWDLALKICSWTASRHSLLHATVCKLWVVYAMR